MSTISITVFLIVAYATTGYCIKCTQCLGRNQETCDDVTTVDCGDDYCITVSERNIIENVPYPTFSKGCQKDIGLCDQLFSARTGDQLTASAQSVCCKEDNCNEMTTFHMDSYGEPNGLYCESCFRNNTKEECHSRDRVQCLGNQTKCLYYSGTLQRSDLTVVDYIVKGCVYEPACKYQLKVLPGTTELEQRVYRCDDPTDYDNGCEV
ncbi:phospholipase A2 inhibitor NAI-like [Pelobates fuscus]|uniref:phospholipase A2 inhibitor NAI-like n=1 Tax=Pelobates fuscus TaxID=191477 RepID=UPI002FE42D90